MVPRGEHSWFQGRVVHFRGEATRVPHATLEPIVRSPRTTLGHADVEVNVDDTQGGRTGHTEPGS